VKRPLPATQVLDQDGAWCFRLWHPSEHTQSAIDRRGYGPLYRFDPHVTPSPDPGNCLEGRSVLYMGEELATAVCETLAREASAVEICPAWQVSILAFQGATSLIDLGISADDLGAPEDLGDAHVASYANTQEWARAIHEDLSPSGIRYHSCRHRGVSGNRLGVNAVLWETAPSPTLIKEEALHAGGVWERVITALDRAGVGAAKVEKDKCRRCP
jgi:hypothetical protein